MKYINHYKEIDFLGPIIGFEYNGSSSFKSSEGFFYSFIVLVSTISLASIMSIDFIYRDVPEQVSNSQQFLKESKIHLKSFPFIFSINNNLGQYNDKYANYFNTEIGIGSMDVNGNYNININEAMLNICDFKNYEIPSSSKNILEHYIQGRKLYCFDQEENYSFKNPLLSIDSNFVIFNFKKCKDKIIPFSKVIQLSEYYNMTNTSDIEYLDIEASGSIYRIPKYSEITDSSNNTFKFLNQNKTCPDNEEIESQIDNIFIAAIFIDTYIDSRNYTYPIQYNMKVINLQIMNGITKRSYISFVNNIFDTDYGWFLSDNKLENYISYNDYSSDLYFHKDEQDKYKHGYYRLIVDSPLLINHTKRSYIKAHIFLSDIGGLGSILFIFTQVLSSKHLRFLYLFFLRKLALENKYNLEENQLFEEQKIEIEKRASLRIKNSILLNNSDSFNQLKKLNLSDKNFCLNNTRTRRKSNLLYKRILNRDEVVYNLNNSYNSSFYSNMSNDCSINQSNNNLFIFNNKNESNNRQEIKDKTKSTKFVNNLNIDKSLYKKILSINRNYKKDYAIEPRKGSFDNLLNNRILKKIYNMFFQNHNAKGILNNKGNIKSNLKENNSIYPSPKKVLRLPENVNNISNNIEDASKIKLNKVEELKFDINNECKIYKNITIFNDSNLGNINNNKNNNNINDNNNNNIVKYKLNITPISLIGKNVSNKNINNYINNIDLNSNKKSAVSIISNNEFDNLNTPSKLLLNNKNNISNEYNIINFKKEKKNNINIESNTINNNILHIKNINKLENNELIKKSTNSNNSNIIILNEKEDLKNKIDNDKTTVKEYLINNNNDNIIKNNSSLNKSESLKEKNNHYFNIAKKKFRSETEVNNKNKLFKTLRQSTVSQSLLDINTLKKFLLIVENPSFYKYIKSYICCDRKTKLLYNKQMDNIEKLISIEAFSKLMTYQYEQDNNID